MNNHQLMNCCKAIYLVYNGGYQKLAKHKNANYKIKSICKKDVIKFKEAYTLVEFCNSNNIELKD
jgi:hypothetical protein